MNPCDIGRERIHALFDEHDTPSPADDVRAHLASCPGCHELFDDLVTLRGALRGMPRHSLPSEALEAVWDATIRAHPVGWFTGVRRAAAAAVIVTGVSLTTLWLMRIPAGPSAEEIARAEAQADLVFGYTARALDATRNATERRVIASKVAPAVRGTSGAPASARRESP